MQEENASTLATLQEDANFGRPDVDPSVLAELTAERQGPRIIKLAQNSKEVKTTEIEDGTFVLTADTPNLAIPLGVMGEFRGDYGCKIEGIVIACRPCAILTEGETLKAKTYNPTDPKFREIMGMQPDRENNISPAYGTEMLFYLPPHMINLDQVKENRSRRKISEDELEGFLATQSAALAEGCMATFFFKKTNASNSPVRDSHVKFPQVMTLSSKLVESGSLAWWITPHREYIDPEQNPEVKAWVEKAAKYITPESVAPFRAATKQLAGGGEVIDEDERNEGNFAR
jgi:hypothetical protein